jgi:hypothetical protein
VCPVEINEEIAMKRNKFLVVIGSALVLSLCVLEAKAQSDDLPKYEVGVLFTSITEPSFDNGHTEPGFGGRFTFNLNRSVALEAEGNFFPHKCRSCGGGFGDSNGNISQGFIGVKAGKRFQKWGIFAKGRPGLVSFSQGDVRYVNTGAGGPFPFEFLHTRLTNFAVDVGGVLEFYPSKRIVTRFDAGDTMIHYGRRQSNFLLFDPFGVATLVPFTLRAETRHNFQFSAGVGFRF